MFSTFKDYLRCIQIAVQKSNRFDAPWAVISPLYCRCVYGIGARDFSLFSLHSKPCKTWQDYIANEPFKAMISPVASPTQRHIVDDKLAFHGFCNANQINTPTVLDTFHLNTEQSVRAFWQRMAQYPQGDYFAKSRFGSHGAHAFSFQVNTGQATAKTSFEERGPLKKIINDLAALDVEIIVQPKVFNHPSMMALTASESLSTIRVVTVRNDNDIRLIAACARIIVGDNQTDSFFHGQRGNLVAEISLHQGLIIRCKQSCDQSFPNIVDIDCHPISKIRLLGFRIPYWQQLIQEVTQAHLAFDGLKSVGWDVAITPDNALIIEANWRYDVDLIQVSHDRGFMPLIKPYFHSQGTDHEQLHHRHS